MRVLLKDIRMALSNLRRFKLRSALTVLGVFIGTASVVALLSGGQIATAHALSEFKQLGTDLLAVGINYKEKNKIGVPSLYKNNEKLAVSFSTSHHGNYGGLVILQ